MRNLIHGAAALAVFSLLIAGGQVKAQNLNGEYTGSPNADWFARQSNSRGGYCCNDADGHPFDGDYQINPDASVTIYLAAGGSITIDSKEAHGTWDGVTAEGAQPPDPNPTGGAVIWYTGTLSDGQNSNVYCFVTGALT